MKKNIFYFLFLAILLSSCKKDIAPTAFGSAEDLLLAKVSRLINTKGGITIAAHEDYSKSRNKMITTYQIDGSFDDNPFDKVEVGDITLEPLQATRPDILTNQYVVTKAYNQDQINSVFGRKVSIRYHKPGASVDLRSDMSIESPPPLGLDVPGIGGTSSFRNVPVTWVAGSSNNNVYILISFQPESISNPQFRNYSRVDRFISVPDNGSYTITNDKFSGIPQGAQFIVAVARGNTALAIGMANGTDRTGITAIATGSLVGTIGGGGSCSGICIEPL